MNLPNALNVKFYDGQYPLAATATLIFSGPMVKVIGTTVAENYPVRELRVSPQIGTADRFIQLPNGGQLQCHDHPYLNRLRQEGKAEGIVAWLERRWRVALLSVILTVFALTAGYIYGVPVVADYVAAKLSIENERKLGRQAIQWLDNNNLLKPSHLSPDTQDAVKVGFTQFTQDLPLAPYYQLEFRDAPVIGANAFALPGGIIVLTDDLVKLGSSKEEVLAVLAHEIGHVEHRHALRLLLNDAMIAAASATLTSDASSLTLAVSGLPVLMAQTKYSREFETQADDFAFALLKKHQLSPELFATIMEKLTKEHSEDDERTMSFVSTHPITADRIARAKAAAK